MTSNTNDDDATLLLKMLHQFGEFSMIATNAHEKADMYMDTFNHHQKPLEWLQVMLDVIRCTYEPRPMGSLLLNGNPSFIANALQVHGSVIYYTSQVVGVSESFSGFYRKQILSSMSIKGGGDQKVSLFVIVSSATNNITLSLLDHVGAILSDCDSVSLTSSMVGFCCDDALTDKFRVSVLAIANDQGGI